MTGEITPIEMTLIGLFQAVGPLRWLMLGLTVGLVTIAVCGVYCLTKPVSERQQHAGSLSRLKEWNAFLSMLLAVAGPAGTYIGCIAALLAMSRIAFAADAAIRLAAQSDFFQAAATMFISSLAGVTLGIALGSFNGLLLFHVLPDHRHPTEEMGMVASAMYVMRSWVRGKESGLGRRRARRLRPQLPAAREVGEG